ncbi:glucose-1-phosphate cytidylyltransferase [Selenomonas sp. oral taxon 126]|jgi:glucose-1-phosphate cytidylyltransferase|uniref:glucose-1-phosphate cytidylyltransferase n=1 Tax=Selenomonas sp. oral taxon 126 TaxID=712528 RepID=UPI000807755B|nr:glucose-1-phosphate cytidylyltransferase [Selenomonas sp. oral taxon 126]ANR71758.1 glucose-1-phosphate cytidylyltransferase [Selenomonas sp. oral taxon 126]
MKVVILAGGLGTRISEESALRPKPMIEIGGKPILWHIMKIYSHYGFHEFVICLGYKGYMIKEYFADYYLHTSDVTFDFTQGNAMTVHNNVSEPWKVTLVDTGLHAQTGCRIKRVQKYIGDEPFLLTYGDGVSDVDLNALIKMHTAKKGQALVTMTAIQPGGRFGVLDIESGTNEVSRFVEKAKENGGWINGGFMVVEPKVFDYLRDADDCVFETTPLETIAREGGLHAYKHTGFWQCMDTQRDKVRLEQRWESGKAPWKLWA